jgi:adenylate cyclase
MQIGLENIREILDHHLNQEDFERLLRGLDDAGKAELFHRIVEHLRRSEALVDIANRVSDTLSLDVLFPRLMAVVTEALDADRSSLFLHDPETEELFSRVIQGDAIGEIRFPCHLGVAGSIFTSGEAEIIADAYADPRFNQEVDRHTGYHTRNILCVPIRNKKRQVIGVTQVLNKRTGEFDAEDQRLLEGLSLQASAALENARLFEKVERQQREEAMLLEVSASIVSEIHLDPLLMKIMAAATSLLDADRGTLFLYDAARDELFSRVAGGIGGAEIRFPAIAGIAGECFTSGRVINIADAYSDSRFNPEFDRHTGYHTHSMLCMPIVARGERKIGVMQISTARAARRRRGGAARLLGPGRRRHRECKVVQGGQRRTQLQRGHSAQHEQCRADAGCRRRTEEGQRIGATHSAPQRRRPAGPHT